MLDLGERHHVLLAAGRSLDTDSAQLYLAYQLTFGPREPAEREGAGH